MEKPKIEINGSHYRFNIRNEEGMQVLYPSTIEFTNSWLLDQYTVIEDEDGIWRNIESIEFTNMVVILHAE